MGMGHRIQAGDVMARYRKVDPRIWNDAKFRSLSDSSKLIFFFLLTHPHMTAIGAMRSSAPGLAAEIGWSTEAFAEAFHEVTRKGMAEHDEKASLIWLPNFVRYNPPESPNVVKAWASALEMLPECSLLNRVVAGSVAFAQSLNKGFSEALPEAFSKGMPYQEQEQEQEQEQDKSVDAPPASPPPRPKKPKAESGDETRIQAACRETFKAYASAYWDRYQTEPVVNAKVRSQIKQFVQRLPYEEAPLVAAFYVGHPSAFYVRKGHDVGSLLADAEKLRTEWVTNRSMTDTQARQGDRMAANANSADEAMRILEAQGAA